MPSRSMGVADKRSRHNRELFEVLPLQRPPPAASTVLAVKGHMIWLSALCHPSSVHGAMEHAAAGSHGGVAVGGLVCRKRVVQTVIKALDERQWRKTRVKVSSYDDEQMVVAVVPEGVRALDAHSEKPCDGVPAALASLIQSGEVTWMSGLRAGAAVATAGRGGGAAEGVEPAFRYAELFAGIGGFRLGLDALGGRCVFSSEIDACAAATYERNFHEAPFGDIVEVPTEA